MYGTLLAHPIALDSIVLKTLSCAIKQAMNTSTRFTIQNHSATFHTTLLNISS
jgi:hypothetical protein